MDSQVQEVILKDPRIQAAVQQVGEEALADPRVQQQIVNVCREKFPEVVAAVQEQVAQWANDPQVQQRACELAGVARLYAGHVAGYAEQAAGQAGDQLLKIIEQGPAGVRMLAFVGGAASCINACLMMSDFGKVFGNPVKYVLFVYQVLFSVTTILFEAKPEWISSIPVLSGYQDLIILKAHFLSEVAGRGMFYGFQGSLWLRYASEEQLQNWLLGLYFYALCAFHISMHFGIMPQHIAQKIREGGYIAVPAFAHETNDEEALAIKETSAISGQSPEVCKDVAGALNPHKEAEKDKGSLFATTQESLDVAQQKICSDPGTAEDGKPCSAAPLEPTQTAKSQERDLEHFESYTTLLNVDSKTAKPQERGLDHLDGYTTLLNVNHNQLEHAQIRSQSREVTMASRTHSFVEEAPVVDASKSQQKCCRVM